MTTAKITPASTQLLNSVGSSVTKLLGGRKHCCIEVDCRIHTAVSKRFQTTKAILEHIDACIERGKYRISLRRRIIIIPISPQADTYTIACWLTCGRRPGKVSYEVIHFAPVSTRVIRDLNE